jgi:hypothetical protein
MLKKIEWPFFYFLLYNNSKIKYLPFSLKGIIIQKLMDTPLATQG